MIKLYVCEISNLIEKVKADERSLETYFDKLGKMRIEHILKNNRAEDRARTLGAALLLLFALNKEGIDADVLPDFAYQGNGKPYLKEFPQVHFNISHTKNIITCVISCDEVGVDVEHIRELKDVTIKKVFSENERKIAGEQMAGYVRLWTAKEACAKLLGTGLSDILDGLEIVCDDSGKYVKKLNQDIRKTSRYIVIAEGELTDSLNYPYCYSICANEKDLIELVYAKWDNQQIKLC